MPIPLMRDVLAQFPTCQEGIDWVSDRNVKQIYSELKNPGWFMFVLMNTHTFPRAVGFEAAMRGLYNCMSLTDHFLPIDQQAEKAVESAYSMSQGYEPYSDLSSESERDMKCVMEVYEEIKKSGVTVELSNRMYYFKLAHHFIDTVMFRGRPREAGKSAHQAGDCIVTACVAAIHPGMLSPAFGHNSVIDAKAVESDRSKISILGCDLIREVVPYLFSD